MAIFAMPSDCPVQQRSVPPNNYLWKSPHGIAYLGWQHQLILHLLACDRKWVEQDVGLSAIKYQLRTKYPDCVMDNVSLRAVGTEYLNLSLEARMAYRFMTPPIRAAELKHDVDMPAQFNLWEPDWESMLDPALFEHIDSSPTTRPDRGSSPLAFSDSTVRTSYSDSVSPKLHDQSRTLANLDCQPATPGHFTANCGSTQPATVTGRRLGQYISLPKTPTKSIILSTPSRPLPDRFVDRQELSPPISQTRSNGLPLPQTSSVDRAIGRILFFSQQIHKARQDDRSNLGMAQPRFTIVDGNTIDTSEMRLPNPMKYVQTSKNHFTIPESEAEAFIYWFEPKVDAMPDKIEGYLWYCDDCYVPGGSAGNAKGKFIQKRSVQKHYELIHRKEWKPVLPEPNRAAVKGNTNEAEDDADQSGEKSGHGVGASVESVTQKLRGKIGIEDDVDELSGETNQTRTVRAPKRRVRINFRDVDAAKATDK